MIVMVFFLIFSTYGIPPKVQSFLEKRWKLSDTHSKKLEYLIQFEKPSFQLKETWWILNNQEIKLQTQVLNQSWLKWEILYKNDKLIGPHPKEFRSSSLTTFLSQRIFFGLNNKYMLPLNQEVVLSRQSGRIAIKLESINDLFIWLDQDTLEFIRIRLGDRCDFKFQLTQNPSVLPVKQTIFFDGQTLIAELKENLLITKFDPQFFLQHSGEWLEDAQNLEQQEILNVVKKFYQLCR